MHINEELYSGCTFLLQKHNPRKDDSELQTLVVPALYKPIHVLHLPNPNNQCLSPLHLPLVYKIYPLRKARPRHLPSVAPAIRGTGRTCPFLIISLPHRAFHLMIRFEGRREVRWVHLRLPILFVPAAYEVLDWRSPSMFWYLVVRLAPAQSSSDGPLCFGRSILLRETL